MEFIDRVSISILNEVGTTQHTFTVEGPITPIVNRLRQVEAFQPANGQAGTYSARLTVRDPSTNR